MAKAKNPMKLVPWAAAALLASGAPLAHAGFVDYPTADGTIRLGAEYAYNVDPAGNNVPLANGMATPPASIYTTGSGADMYLYQDNGSGSNVFFHTYGFTGGSTYFGARASGQGSFYASTFARFTQTYTNTTSTAQLFNFAFNVDFGELGITGAGQGFAGLMLRVNTTSGSSTTTRAQDYTEIRQTSTPADVQCSDSDIGSLAGYISCSGNTRNLSGSAGTYNVDLGLVGAGESFTLDYDIIATVAGELAESSSYGYGFGFNGCNNAEGANLFAVVDDGYGGDPNACAAPSFFPGMAIARSGDPFNGPQFGTGGPSAFSTANFSVTSTSAVPEPGSLALVGAAAGALLLARRRRAAGDTADRE
jgi:hypothetical protein